MKKVRVLFLVALTSLHTAAHADVIISFQEVGSDVVASYSGSLDLTGASPVSSGQNANVVYLWPAQSQFYSFSRSVGNYDGWLFPSVVVPTFGTGSMGIGNANLTTGFNFSFDNAGGGNGIGVTSGYTSGAAFAGSATFENATFSSLGITPGTYTWTAGNNNMTLTTQAVPEPATSAMAFVGLAYGTYSMFRRRKQA